MNEIEKRLTDEEERLLKELKAAEVGGAQYDEVIKNLDKIAEIRRKDRMVKNEEKRDITNVAVKVGSGALALTTFLLMLKQEQTGSLRTKGFDWFRDFLKKSDK